MDVRGGRPRWAPPYFNTKKPISKEASAHTDGGNPVLRISLAAKKDTSAYQPRTSATDVRGGRPRRTPPYFEHKLSGKEDASACQPRTSATDVHGARPRWTPPTRTTNQRLVSKLARKHRAAVLCSTYGHRQGKCKSAAGVRSGKVSRHATSHVCKLQSDAVAHLQGCQHSPMSVCSHPHLEVGSVNAWHKGKHWCARSTWHQPRRRCPRESCPGFASGTSS